MFIKMKTTKLSFLLITFFILFSVTGLRAQWTDMNWETNNLKFKYPTNFTIKQNDASVFTASGSIFIVTIKAWEDDEFYTAEEICKEAATSVSSTEMKLISESALDYQNGLVGHEAYYTANQNGKLMHMVIGGYQDEVLMYDYSVQILYWDDPKQNDVNYKAAIYILRSLGLIDE